MKKITVSFILCAALMLSACTVNINTSESETEKTKDTSETSETVETTTEETQDTETQATDSQASEISAANVVCQWRDEALKVITDYEWYANEDGPSESQVMFYTDARVTDFSFYEIRNISVDDSGKFIFDEMEIFTQPELVPENGLLVNIYFAGDLPEYAFSYVDVDGTTKTYLISQSGNDGSIVTEAYN